MPAIARIYRTGSKRHFTVVLDCGHKYVVENAIVKSLQLYVGKADQECGECFLADLFEFEYCPECGGDAQHHTICVTPIGNLFARCNHPPSAETNWEQHPVIAKFRKEAT